MKVDEIKTLDQLLEATHEIGRGKHADFLETKADENLSVTNDPNWHDAYGVVNAIKDLTAKSGHLMSELSEGYEGDSLPVSYPIPYNITDYFMLGKSEWEDEARPAFNNTNMTASKSTLTQVEFIIQFGVTDKMVRHSTDKGLFDKVVAIGEKAALRTMEGCIFNGDSETGATGNVNSDDQAPATTFGSAQYHSLKIDHGIRENAITNSNTDNTATFDSDLFMTVKGLLGSQYQDVTNILCIAEPATYNKILTDDGIKLATNTMNPTIDGSGKDFIKPFGIKTFSHTLVPKTEADGKVSATPANNTKGQYVMVYAPAVRWGFGQNVMTEVERVQGYGWEITITMEFSFVILDLANTCAAGINLTV